MHLDQTAGHGWSSTFGVVRTSMPSTTMARATRLSYWDVTWPSGFSRGTAIALSQSSAWESIVAAVNRQAYLPYFIVPMARVENNSRLLNTDFNPPANEEPQVILRRDAKEMFERTPSLRALAQGRVALASGRDRHLGSLFRGAVRYSPSHAGAGGLPVRESRVGRTLGIRSAIRERAARGKGQKPRARRSGRQLSRWTGSIRTSTG